MMTQRLKLFYGILGAVIGICIGAFFKSFNTMEAISQCSNLLAYSDIQIKCKLLNCLNPFSLRS